jgi:hypothetical protein
VAEPDQKASVVVCHEVIMHHKDNNPHLSKFLVGQLQTDLNQYQAAGADPQSQLGG